jgi:hypothetical protein
VEIILKIRRKWKCFSKREVAISIFNEETERSKKKAWKKSEVRRELTRIRYN